MSRQIIREAEPLVDLVMWNALHPVGTMVRYWTGAREGEGVVSETRSKAWKVCGTPSVQVMGQPGVIALAHIEVID